MSEKEKINQTKMDLLARSIAIQLRSRFRKDDILYFKRALEELLQEETLPDRNEFNLSDNVILTVSSTLIERGY